MTSEPGLRAALELVARSPALLVASDFDGVLAPLVDDPMTSRALPGTLDDLCALAALPSTYAALVSGRDLATLAQLTGQGADSPLTLIGGHGAQSTRADIGITLSETEQASLDAVNVALHAALGGVPGARLELKPTATVLHTRTATPPDAAEAGRRAAEVLAEHPELTVLRGKDVVEVTPLVVDKGSALAALARALDVDAVVYFGDDVTDENVFIRLSPADLGIKVGLGATHAAHRVAGPPDVAAALTALRLARQLRDAGA